MVGGWSGPSLKESGMINVEEVMVVQTGLPRSHVALYVSLWLLRGVINGDLDHVSKDRVFSRATWVTRWREEVHLHTTGHLNDSVQLAKDTN